MNVLAIMLAVWGVLLTGFIALMIYRGHLHLHETDQLFLSDNSNELAVEEHNRIVELDTKIQPLYAGFGSATAIVAALIVGVYIVEQLPNIHF
jgi:hypothetical protein